jgi:hypothetical protein
MDPLRGPMGMANSPTLILDYYDLLCTVVKPNPPPARRRLRPKPLQTHVEA